MSGFSCNHEDRYSLDDAPFQHYPNLVHGSCSLQTDDTNIGCFHSTHFHFGSKEVNAATSSFDAIEVPDSSGPFCVLKKRSNDDINADTEMATQMPKTRKKKNSKQTASRKNDEKKMKTVSKTEKEAGQSQGTPELGYVHVRARRGQATDSHSLAERVRREKLGEKMKLLQSLVPGCDKIAGKAQVLDEIISYVQSLQTQLQILVTKLSILSPYASSSHENNLERIDEPPTTTTERICSLEASLSCIMESSCNNLPLHCADDSHHNSLVSSVSSSSSSSSLTSQVDQKYFILQGTELFPLWENDVDGQIGAFYDEYWLDHFAQLQ